MYRIAVVANFWINRTQCTDSLDLFLTLKTSKSKKNNKNHVLDTPFVTAEQVICVENIVNELIRLGKKVTVSVYTKDKLDDLKAVKKPFSVKIS